MVNCNLKELKNKKFHFIGIGGISMSALAQMLIKEKIYVQGSDESENDEVLKLKKKGVLIFNKHRKRNLKEIDIVVYSSAISLKNPEIRYAIDNNLIMLKRAELLSIIAKEYKTVISIAGSHGKTTTAAMISEIFLNAGLNPTIHIGGVLNKINSNYKIGNKKIFVTESCEYKDNFLTLNPDLSVILNIDSDHLDYFKNLDNIKKSFLKFANNIKEGGLNIACADDFNSRQLIKTAKCVNFGLKNGIIIANNIKKCENDKYLFDVVFYGFLLGKIKLNMIGKHNIYNSLAAIFVALLCGIDFCSIKNSLEKFEGVKRRCEFLGEYNSVLYYHDYAHHPKQIKEMIKVGKSLAKERKGRFFVVFEPHTYSRTKYLIDEFVSSFKGVDYVYLAPVYSARERKKDGFDSNKLMNLMMKKDINVKLFFNYDEIKKEIFLNCLKNDVVFILGAGSIEKIAKTLKNK